jgi:uncharacterized protein YcnI
MRCSGWSSLAISACSALVLAASAAAHIVATPGFLPSGSSRSVELAGPNERDEPMTGFRITAPAGLIVEHAHDAEGWTASFDDTGAEWTGGPLGTDVEQIFGITLRADVEPGVFELMAEQLYADRSVVSWPVGITVTPAEESPSQNLAIAGVVALIGVLAVIAIALFALRRRSGDTLQEK